MNHSEWRTRFDEAKQLFPETKKLPLTERIGIETQRLIDAEASGEMSERSVFSEMERLAEEYLWLLADRPYYKIHPKLVPHLCRCKLDKLPASYLEVPGNFDTVHIRFSGHDPHLAVSDEEYVRSILLSKPVLGRLDNGECVSLFEHGKRPRKLDTASDQLVLRIDLGERGACGSLSYVLDWVITVRLDPNKTLDEEFATYEGIAPERIAPGTRRREVVENCLRLIATVGLIANSPDKHLLEYDILSKNRMEFGPADEKRKGELIAKARQRGKHGWNVGTNDLFVGEVPPWTKSTSSGQGRELSHAHIRTGHLHAVRCGEGKRYVKIKWFRPTVVRPDLPFQSNDR